MRKIVLLLIGVFFLLLAAGVSAEDSVIKSVRFSTAAEYTRFVFDLSSPLERRIFLLDNPRRVVIDLKKARLSGKISQPSTAHNIFSGVRSGIRNKTDVRFVIDLKKPVKTESFLLSPRGTYGHRLVVDLYEPGGTKSPKVLVNNNKRSNKQAKKISASIRESDRKSTPVIAKSKPSVVEQKKNNARKARVAKVKSRTKIKISAKPQLVADSKRAKRGKPKAKLKVTKRAPKLREVIVAIDAGHGGNDSGARGPRGAREKDVVIAIARKLEALIRVEPGMRPIMIRKGDYYVGLRERMKKARAAKADLFVSIHADAFKKSTVRGSSVFTLSRRGASREAARWRSLVAHENAADLVGGVSLDDKDDMLASVLLDLSQTATQEASSDVAAKVLRNLKKMGVVHKKTVQSAGFVVLKSPDIPSILVETAFISNPSEEMKLITSAYQKRLAKAVFRGLQDYFAVYAPPGTRIAARRHTISRGETLSGIAQQYGVSTKRLQLANALSSSNIRIGQVLEIPEGS